MTSTTDRKQVIELVEEAQQSGARRSRIAAQLGLSLRTLNRWKDEQGQIQSDKRPEAQRPIPHNKLSEEKRQHLLDVCNQAEYASLPPSQIVLRLADQGIYLASESTLYRLLWEVAQLERRGKAQAPKKPSKPASYCATAPNQVWSWDITYLAAAIKGQFYRLYLIMDIYSRKIVAWEVHERESAEQASVLMKKACLREGIRPDQLALHADNGGLMKGATMLATLQKLGVVPSFSRPSVSDDNPYSEALFRTLKYAPQYPERWSGKIRNWNPVTEAWLNPDHESTCADKTPLESLVA